jgi:hypothetical protein
MHVIDRRASAGRAVYARKLLFTKENMIYIGKYYYLLPWRCPRTPRPHARGLREHILVREHWSDVGCGCGRVCASLCIVRECATAAGESERERETERGREREREKDSECVCDTHTHTHTRSPRTAWTYLALPKVHPVLLLRRARALLLHHHLPAQVHFPTYLAHPSLLLGPSCHIRW